MVEGGGLENRCTERYRGFESYSLRQTVLSAPPPHASTGAGFAGFTGSRAKWEDPLRRDGRVG